MPKVLHQKVTVQPVSKVDIGSSELELIVDVLVLYESAEWGRSVIGILNGGPERRLFQMADEVKVYLPEEKAS